MPYKNNWIHMNLVLCSMLKQEYLCDQEALCALEAYLICHVLLNSYVFWGWNFIVNLFSKFFWGLNMITSGERELLLPKTMVLFAMLQSLEIFAIQKSCSIFSISIVPCWILSSLWYIYTAIERSNTHKIQQKDTPIQKCHRIGMVHFYEFIF